MHYDVDQTVGEKVGNVVDVVHHADEDFAAGTGVEIVKGQFLNMRKNVGANPVDNAVPRLGGQDRLEKGAKLGKAGG